jgi:serine/threonine protein kinase
VKIGSLQTTGFTPIYAAPEIARLFKTRNRTGVVGPELDAWSLGVITLELLLGRPLFGYFAVPEKVRQVHALFCCVYVRWFATLRGYLLTSLTQLRVMMQCCKEPVIVQVIDLLADPNSELPWEGDRLTDADKAKLGSLHGFIMPLLHRDPAQRGTVAEFRANVESLFLQ